MRPLLPLSYDKSRSNEESSSQLSGAFVKPQPPPDAGYDIEQEFFSNNRGNKRRTESNTSDIVGSSFLTSSSSFVPIQAVDHSMSLGGMTSSPVHHRGLFCGEGEEIDVDDEVGATMLPSSPPMFPQSQSTLVDFSQKQQHPLSRNSSSLAEPLRKRQKGPTNLSVFAAPLEELALDRDGRVYGILLQDSTFPEGYRPSLYDDPTFFVVKNSEKAGRAAAEIITNLFDRETDETNRLYTLELEELGLSSLPEQIADFKDLVLYGRQGIIKPILHVHASKNELRSLTPRIFEIEGLEVLALRANKIARVPGLIEKLQSLKSLNLSNNKIKFLPHNILELNNLQTLRIRPNPLIEARDRDKVRKINGCSLDRPDRRLRCFGQLYWTTKNKQVSKSALNAIMLARNLSTLQERDPMVEDTESSSSAEQAHIRNKTCWVSKLSELALRSISQYLISQSELLRWKQTVPERVYRMAIKALIHGNNGETCGHCGEVTVESVAEMMEWWDFKDAVGIPVKRRFCSKRCACTYYEELTSKASQ